METREIPKEQWDSYLEGFNRNHLGQRVRMEQRTPGAEGRIQADNTPLLGITPQAKPGSGDEFRALSIETGTARARQQHTVHDPTRLWVAESDGTAAAIQVEDRNGGITLLHFDVSSASQGMHSAS